MSHGVLNQTEGRQLRARRSADPVTSPTREVNPFPRLLDNDASPIAFALRATVLRTLRDGPTSCQFPDVESLSNTCVSVPVATLAIAGLGTVEEGVSPIAAVCPVIPDFDSATTDGSDLPSDTTTGLGGLNSEDPADGCSLSTGGSIARGP